MHDTSRQHGEQASNDERAEADRRASSNGMRPMVGASMRQPKALP
jgi:hypothetical protein